MKFNRIPCNESLKSYAYKLACIIFENTEAESIYFTCWIVKMDNLKDDGMEKGFFELVWFRNQIILTRFNVLPYACYSNICLKIYIINMKLMYFEKK